MGLQETAPGASSLPATMEVPLQQHMAQKKEVKKTPLPPMMLMDTTLMVTVTTVMEIMLLMLYMIHLLNLRSPLLLHMAQRTPTTTRLPTARLVLNGTRQSPPTVKSRTMKILPRLIDGAKSLHLTMDPRVLLNTQLMPMPILSLVRITLHLPQPLRNLAADMMYTPCRLITTELNLLQTITIINCFYIK